MYPCKPSFSVMLVSVNCHTSSLGWFFLKNMYTSAFMSTPSALVFPGGQGCSRRNSYHRFRWMKLTLSLTSFLSIIFVTGNANDVYPSIAKNMRNAIKGTLRDSLCSPNNIYHIIFSAAIYFLISEYINLRPYIPHTIVPEHTRKPTMPSHFSITRSVTRSVAKNWLICATEQYRVRMRSQIVPNTARSLQAREIGFPFPKHVWRGINKRQSATSTAASAVEISASHFKSLN